MIRSRAMTATARFLVGIDFSPGSRKALAEARRLAAHCGAKITIAHVRPVSDVRAAVSEDRGDLVRAGGRVLAREIDAHLRRVHLMRDKPEQLNPIERKVHDLFADSSDPMRFRNAIGTFRAQRGLREKTERALRVSGQYLPKMEAIFAAEGLPVALTRLPLVESSFNVEAYSKVGAAGLWSDVVLEIRPTPPEGGEIV